VTERLREHTVGVVIDGTEIRGWTSYDIQTSMIEPVHSFSLSLPFDRKAWERCRPDRRVRVQIDGVTIIDGFVDEREILEAEDVLQIGGRNRAGRLVQESAPGVEFRGMDLVQLVTVLAAPWYTYVSLVNTRNRDVLRGKGKKARAGREPVYVSTAVKSKLGSRIEPGQTRMQVIEDLCRQAEILCWPSGDGYELILGRPNYDQAPQFRFFMPAADSARASEANVLGLGYKESTGDRYSEIIVVGSGGGTDANYGGAVTSRVGRAHSQPDDFVEPKRLVLEKSVSSAAEAEAWAQREMRRRDMQGRRVTVRAPLHGQIMAGQYHTIFAPDLAASIEDERTGLRGAYHVVSCAYQSTRNRGEETVLEFVPTGQELSM
jgi:prophage tail gpP-like protein